MTFANCQMGGMNMASPDVCKTPVGPSVVPIPYPNMAQGATANPGTAVQKVLISGTPAHNIQTMIPMSNGDQPGVIGGVISGIIMGPCKHLMGANSVLIGGMPATKMTDTTGQNGTSFNAQGTTVAPAQTKVMINSGGSSSSSQSSTTSAQQSNSKDDSKKPQKMSIKNPRWEHADDQVADKRPKATLVGDKITLKADVTNVQDGAYLSFKVFDTTVSPPQIIGTAYGVVANGVGEAEWRVKRFAKLEIEGKVYSLISNRAKLPVSKVWAFSL